jgi:hypothetical protein
MEPYGIFAAAIALVGMLGVWVAAALTDGGNFTAASSDDDHEMDAEDSEFKKAA